MKSDMRLSGFLMLAILSAAALGAAGAKAVEYEVPTRVRVLLEAYCCECHDSDLAKGGIRLDNLSELAQAARLDLFNNALEQVYSGEMPPKKGEQPTAAERDELTAKAKALGYEDMDNLARIYREREPFVKK